MSKTLAIEESRAWHSSIAARMQSLDRRSLFLITLIVAALFCLQFQFWKQPSEADRANWDYFSQVIARGGVPYRDVVNIKTPLSAYIGAAAIVASHPFGLRDIFAIRIVYLLLGALTVAFTFLLAHDYFKDRRIALLAAAIMLSFTVFAESNSGGVQPKTPMVLFGLMALWATQKDQPFLAGLFGMLSALSWQPGLLFVGVACLAFSRHLTSWRDLKAIKVIAGASVPLVIAVAYFWAAGALSDFYLWNIAFNYSVYGPGQSRSISGFFDRLSRMVMGTFGNARLYFFLSALGLVLAFSQELKQAGERYLLEGASRQAILIAPVVYFIFCMINIQGGADLIPLLPFIAIFAALALVWLLDRAAGLLSHRLLSRARPQAVEGWGFVGILVLILVLNVAAASSFRVNFPSLNDQQAEVAEITSHLAPAEKIFVHGSAEILALSGLTNADKHFFLDRGKDSYLDQVEPGGFAGWLGRLKLQRPKVVVIDRTKHVEHKDDFLAWVRADYEEYQGRIFTYYVRKETDQR